MWRYISPIGPLYIVELKNGQFGFLYNETIWETCVSPEIQADNIYMHCTGCAAWDLLDGQIADVPKELDDWEVV